MCREGVMKGKIFHLSIHIRDIINWTQVKKKKHETPKMD